MRDHEEHTPEEGPLLDDFIARKGDSWEEVKRWAEDQLRYKWSRIRCHDREDLAQETVLATFISVSRPSFRLRHRFRTYVSKVAWRLARRFVDESARWEALDFEPCIADPSPPADECLDREQERAWFGRELKRQPPRVREAVGHFVGPDEPGFKVIAFRMDCTPTTIRAYISSARGSLRRRWKRREAA